MTRTELTMFHVTRHQRGFSLIELMIAMVLGLILLFAATQFFVYTKQSVTRFIISTC